MKGQQISAVLAVGALATVLWLFVSEAVFALPVYAAKTGQPCGYCHVNQAGGGELTPNGSSYQANNHTVKVPPVRTSTQSSATVEAGSASDAQSHAERALSLFNRGNYSGAIAEYGKAISMEPSNARLFLNRGLAEFKLERYDAAFSDFNKSISLDPSEPVGYGSRGGVWMMRRNFQNAAADFSKALSLSPGNRIFSENLNRARAAMGSVGAPTVQPAAPVYAQTQSQTPRSKCSRVSFITSDARQLAGAGPNADPQAVLARLYAMSGDGTWRGNYAHGLLQYMESMRQDCLDSLR